jgi:hypothetical protein
VGQTMKHSQLIEKMEKDFQLVLHHSSQDLTSDAVKHRKIIITAFSTLITIAKLHNPDPVTNKCLMCVFPTEYPCSTLETIERGILLWDTPKLSTTTQ